MSGVDPVKEGLARAEIERALYLYARGVDRRDWALVRSVYHDDAIDYHGSFEGGVDDLVNYLRARHGSIEQSIHFITNIVVDFVEAGAALVESYYFCQQRLKSAASLEKAFGKIMVAEDETVQLTTSGRYIDRFELRAGAWRISHRKVTFDVLSASPTPLGGGLPEELIISRRDKTDVLFQMKEQFGLP